MKNYSYQSWKQKGYNFFVGVPCSGLKTFIRELQKDQKNRYIPAPREDTAIAIAAGAYLAGRKPLVYLQSSGLGNIVNISTSLLKIYHIPLHLLISLRKTPVEHFFMATITKQLVKLLQQTKSVTYIEEKAYD